MTYTVPTLAQLADFSGRDESSYRSFIDSALRQATLMFVVATGLSEPPTDLVDLEIATYGILSMADEIYLAQPHAEASVGPFQSESIGSYCVDEETEILTELGWKNCDSLNQGDVVLTLNEDTWQSEWQPVLDVYKFSKAVRNMLLIDSKRFSSFTTMEHRWLTRFTGWITTKQLVAPANKDIRIPFAAPHGGFPSEPKYSDALVELVAWFWTEGGWSWKGRHRSVKLHQSYKVNAPNCVRIRSALTEVFGPVSKSLRTVRGEVCSVEGCVSLSRVRDLCKPHYMDYWRSGSFDHSIGAVTWVESHPNNRPGVSVFSLSAEASEILTAHVTYEDKAVHTDFIRSLTLSQLLLFIEVSILADASGPKQLSQKNKTAAEQFMLACILAGKRVSFHQAKSSMWQVTFTSSYLDISPYSIKDGLSRGTKSKYEVVSYDGRVWCPRTSNGTWLARRHGTIYFTGNSYSRRAQQQIIKGDRTGVSWFDLAVRRLRSAEDSQIFSGQVSIFENDNLYQRSSDGSLVVLGPRDMNAPSVAWSDSIEIPQSPTVIRGPRG